MCLASRCRRILLALGWIGLCSGCGWSSHLEDEQQADAGGDGDGDRDHDVPCDEFCEGNCHWGWDDDVDRDNHMCEEDCNAEDPTTYLGAPDEVGDGIDQSCDGADGIDADGDGFASFESGGDDCDDQLATTNPGPARDWIIEDVGVSRSGPSDALAIDSAGAAHVVLPDFSLTYSVRSEAGWVSEPIPSEVFTWGPSVAVSSAGDVEVAFESDGIYLATRSGHSGAWAFEEVAMAGEVPRLFLDAQDEPHVVYRAPPGAIVHARRQAGAWQFSDGPNGVEPCDVLVDRSGRLVALAVDEADGDLLLWSLDAETWSASVVAPAVGPVAACALGSGPLGTLHAAWLADRTTDVGGPSTEVWHATSTDGLWSTEAVVSEDDACVNLSLAVQGDGTAHLGVACLASVRWHAGHGGQWRHDVLGARAPALEHREPDVDLAVDAAGVAQLLYRDGNTWRWMRFAPNDGVDQNCDGRDE